MPSRIRIVAAGALLVWLALPVPPAAAGGGCHTGVTHGDGTAVVMRDACFTPTILYVEPGTEVAFSNEDPLTHNVTANGWGHFDPMNQGDGFTAAFDQPGVYPFACQYHPGMTGAVVVGDGKGDGSGGYVAVEPLAASPEPAGPTGPEAPAVAAEPVPERSNLGWIGSGALGLVVGAGLATGIGVVTRRRRRAHAD
jgi:plastocyanin